VLISGSANYDELRAITPRDDDRFQLHAFVSGGMATMLGAADVVVARAGATTILELAALAKPTILIPNAYLTGGHQLKNAKVYADKGAVEILDEDDLMQDPNLLAVTLRNLLRDAGKRSAMTKAFAAFSKPHAAAQMVDIIEKAIKK
jgi:UDP-N-acetylglucosamine--N-acetylmuramyl-(pentapeptide) pyrophosphoryl-undecaprenol N-acetylglucosamine transferase